MTFVRQPFIANPLDGNSKQPTYAASA